MATFTLNMGFMTTLEERRIEQVEKVVVILKDRYKEQLRKIKI